MPVKIDDVLNARTVDINQVIHYVYHTYAKQLGFSYKDMEEIAESQFRIIRDIIEDKTEFKTINIKHLGKVTPNAWGYKYNTNMKRKAQKREEDRYNH